MQMSMCTDSTLYYIQIYKYLSIKYVRTYQSVKSGGLSDV